MSGRDDLGERLLTGHPRGAQWLQLEVTVANLTFDQLDRLGRLVADTPDLTAARAEVIATLPDGELAARLASRWVRWAGTRFRSAARRLPRGTPSWFALTPLAACGSSADLATADTGAALAAAARRGLSGRERSVAGVRIPVARVGIAHRR